MTIGLSPFHDLQGEEAKRERAFRLLEKHEDSTKEDAMKHLPFLSPFAVVTALLFTAGAVGAEPVKI